MKYIALLRGIGPSNPNMHGSKLKEVLESIGLYNVRPVISSGNVVFETDSHDLIALEGHLEKAWPSRLGFHSTTIIRSQAQLQSLVGLNPYEGLPHGKDLYLLVTFFKHATELIDDNYYTLQGVNALCSAIELGTAQKLMPRLEKQYGKEITSRTWNTVLRILKVMDQQAWQG